MDTVCDAVCDLYQLAKITEKNTVAVKMSGIVELSVVKKVNEC